MSINNTPSNKPVAPDNLVETPAVLPAAPANLTELASSKPVLPANLVEVANSLPVAPANLTELANSLPAAPTLPTRVASALPIAPANLTEIASVKPVLPANLTELAASVPVAPSSLTGIAKAAIARIIVPQFQFNFQDQTYEVNGEPVNLLNVAQYTRPSSATYLDRYIDETGKAAYVLATDTVGSVTNLQPYSDDFLHSSWALSGSQKEITNETSPTGLKATKLVAVADSSTPYILSNAYTAAAGTAFHISLYVKSDGKSDLRLSISGTSTDIYFDLKNGRVLETTSGEAYMQFIGNGWYRVGARIVTAATGNFYIQLSRGNAVSGSMAGDYVLISGAQVTLTDKIQPYVPTESVQATRTFTAKPRIEWDAATGECLGFLVEGTASNLMANSENLENWVLTNSIVTANASMAPDNSFSARKLIASATGSSYPQIARQVSGIGIGNIYTVSFFAKPADTRYVQIRFGGGEIANNPWCNFDAATGQVVAQQPDINAAYAIPVGDGWWRFCVSVTAAAVTLTAVIGLISSPTAGHAIATDQVINRGLFVWGIQVEGVRVVSSYIRTTTSSVTRTTDQLNMPINSKNEFSMFCEADYNAGAGAFLNNRYAMSVSDGTSSNLWLLYNTNSIGTGSYAVQDGVAVPSFTNTAVAPPSGQKTSKAVMSVKPFNFRFWSEKTLRPATQTGLNYQSWENLVSIGGRFTSNVLYGHVRKAYFYDVALEQAEVDSL